MTNETITKNQDIRQKVIKEQKRNNSMRENTVSTMFLHLIPYTVFPIGSHGILSYGSRGLEFYQRYFLRKHDGFQQRRNHLRTRVIPVDQNSPHDQVC